MSEYEIPIGSLEEQALKRKERLKNLKRKIERNDTEEKQQSNHSENGKSHLPSPATLLKESGSAVSSPEEEESDSTAETKLRNEDVVSVITSQLETLKAPLIVDEIDIQNLAPRKPDWDLKRDVAKKLELLDRRTQRAIAEIIRDRLRSNHGDVDLQAVNAANYSAYDKETEDY